MDRLRNLNAAQRDAVETLSGPLLVLAGAGTGKTRVITYRMARLIASGVAPDRILSVTFTNKAAREMQERTSALLGKRSEKRPLVSTFHSLCARILREEITALGYPRSFAICDRGDQESAARKALRDIRVGEKALKPGDLLSIISKWKMAGVSETQAGYQVENDREVLAAAAYRKYQKALRSAGAVDFDDLLLLTCELFESHPDVLQRQQNRFDHVQIDEYQDTNGIQFQLVEALVRPHHCLCVVGDDDQSIYGWRGAEVRHILNFQSHFPSAKIVKLEDNYRCTDQILDLANRLVRHNRGRHEKTLVAHKKSVDAVQFLHYPDEVSEAERVVGEIAYLIEELDVSPAEFAILFRTNEQPRLFESELRRRRIPYQLMGSQSFFDRKEIRDVLAYLKACVYPSDEVSVLRIMNTPARGIGDTTIDKILTRAVAQGETLWNAAAALAHSGEIKPAAYRAVSDFQHLLEKYRHRFQSAPDQMQGTLSAMVEEIQYESEISKQYKTAEQQSARLSTITELTDSIGEYVRRARNPSPTGFLEEIALSDRTFDSAGDRPEETRAVKLMTLHSAKGLEFPRVYLVGLEEGILPHQRSIDGSLSMIEEERRLCYVGVTRAMNELTITRAESRKKWGKVRPTLPSRFLFEMVAAPDDEEESDEMPIREHHEIPHADED